MYVVSEEKQKLTLCFGCPIGTRYEHFVMGSVGFYCFRGDDCIWIYKWQ